ncbi:MAG TPA: hypothetical protein VFO93_19075 [Hymenobacter sp.]|uniref:hypothetical protein n=1 Tax=Hymenobacter sp. TaxID=1898978 RepID=UPI002D7FC9F0|nr:hypothetical protein [Hymenobacter sp.]HET9505655.1 hypothetical protein [Hymenobacter sp.]
MLLAFRFCVATASLLTLTGLLLTGCSSPSPATGEAPATAGTAAAPTPQFPFGSRVDSLNGIAGHPFGQPLSAFSNLRPLPPTPGTLTRTYSYEGKEGWFGQHQAQVSTQLYYFLDGNFCRFLAIGNSTVLRPEVTYLFGPGQAEGKYRLFWEGSRARAAYVEQARGFGMEGRLDVLSKAFEAEQAAQAQTKLKAENAQ